MTCYEKLRRQAKKKADITLTVRHECPDGYGYSKKVEFCALQKKPLTEKSAKERQLTAFKVCLRCWKSNEATEEV